MNKNQQLAFDKFTKLKVGALFMKMGTGKTKVALDLVKYNNVDFMLYITPFSTKANIQTEIEKWGVNCSYEIVGYETIQASDVKYLELLKKLQGKRNFIIADESIFIKNEETKRFKRLCNLRNLCEYALILNGTPLTKNEFDLYNQMIFLSPLIMNMTKPQFINTFFKKITYKKKGQRENTFYKFSEVNAELLHKMIEPYIFQCDLDFDKEENTSFVYIPYEDDGYYIEKQNKLDDYKKKGTSEVIINMLTSLNVIAANYHSKNDEVIKYIKDKQVIVYCTFLEEVNYIKSKCNCFAITSKTKNRSQILANFKKFNKPLLLTYGVGSYSLNMQFCNEIVYSSINFDFGKIEQSKYRIKRIGQQRNIKYTYFLANLGINKLILENLKRKNTLGNLVKEKMMKGDELEWLKNI